MIVGSFTKPFIFCTGLALGIAGFWTTQPSPKRAAPTPAPPPPSSRLDLPEATSAIASWLNLTLSQDAELTYLARLDAEDKQAAELRALLTLLPDQSLPALIETLLTRDGAKRPRFRTIVLETWLDRDPPAVARWITDPRLAVEPELRLQLALQAGLAWARSDFNAAYAWALAQPDRTIADSVAQFILPHLAATDAPRALALAEAQPPDFVARLREPLFARWVNAAPLAALGALGRDILDFDPRSPAVLAALGDWMLRDLSACLDWLKREGPAQPALRQATLQHTLLQLVPRQTSEAVEKLARQLYEKENWSDRSIALTSLASAWMAEDHEAARAWITQLSDPAVRHALIESILPDTWLERPIPGSARSEEYLALALTLPAGPSRTDRLTPLISSWAKFDASAASAWVKQQAEIDPSFSRLAADLAHADLVQLASSNPDEALARFAALPPDANHTRIASDLAAAWGRNDAGAATRWLAFTLPELSSLYPTPHPRAPATLSRAKLAAIHTHPELARAAQTFADLLTLWVDLAPIAALRWAESLPKSGQQDLALTTLALGPPPSATPTPRPDPVQRADLLTQLSDPALRVTYLSLHLADWLKHDYYPASEWMRAYKALPPAISERLLSAHTPNTRSP